VEDILSNEFVGWLQPDDEPTDPDGNNQGGLPQRVNTFGALWYLLCLRARISNRTAGSGHEDLLAVPVEVLAGRRLRVGREQQSFPQRRPSVVLPGQRISRGGVGQRPGDVDAQPAVDSQQAGVKGHIVSRAGRQAVAQISRSKALGGRAVLPRLDVPGQQHPLGAERRGRQPAEHTPAATVRQHVLREHVLAHPGRRQQDPLGLER
jgi:hypothetical protein